MPQSLHSADYRLLGFRLRKARMARDLAQEHVSKLIGYGSQSRIAEIEAGRRRLDLFELRDLVRVYHISLEDLVKEPENGEEKAVAEGVSKPGINRAGRKTHHTYRVPTTQDVASLAPASLAIILEGWVRNSRTGVPLGQARIAAVRRDLAARHDAEDPAVRDLIRLCDGFLGGS